MELVGDNSGRRVVTRDEILSLRPPSDEQLAQFVAHVSWAHSWYKHLPLLSGGEFVFFLAADAGAGYTPEHPRLHYGWKTTEEYRQQYGFLDYMYRGQPGEPLGRDAGPRLDLPADLVAATRVTLYPFLSSDFNAPGACLWNLHADAIALLRGGRGHPSREGVLDWVATQERLDTADVELSGLDRELVLREWDSTPGSGSQPSNVANYLGLKRAAEAAYFRLQHGEEARVRESLVRLTALIEGWRAR
ncbi:hypothetical protein J8F10_03715 [Gemmata sp. G18]|uniref:Uncharacterized protein n=1 Tax=Gemmata palustris TaxID=2822762 RepID=A0ABS5BL10_9BACT|nr:hypothetical protein [Gemmata palustris]MBP3954397.1 hypothetical protein [Gemmata palustris]